MKTLKQRLEQEFKSLEFDNHCSDLYIKYKPEVLAWIKKNYNDSPSIVSLFRSDIDGSTWIEVAFAYSEYYEQRNEYIKNETAKNLAEKKAQGLYNCYKEVEQLENFSDWLENNLNNALFLFDFNDEEINFLDNQKNLDEFIKEVSKIF